MASPFATPRVPIRVALEDGQQTVHVHEAVVGGIPYFSAQSERWANSGLSVKLPNGVDIDAFFVVLERVYFPWKNVFDFSTCKALQVFQVASMLSCAPQVLEDFVLAVRNSVRSDGDAQELTEFCKQHEAPPELAQLAERCAEPPAKRLKVFDDTQLKNMFQGAICRNDEAMIKLVNEHLKQKSQRGTKDIMEVAAIIGAAGTHSGMYTGMRLSAALD
jgi:hypothetical protein